VVWSADSKAFFYVKLDDNHRPMQVWLHRLGTKQADDVLVMRSTMPAGSPISMRAPAAVSA
jgi:oligopeptidase B